MGMKGADLALMAGMLGGSALGGMLGPEGQEMQSFEGKGKDVDPTALLGEGTQTIRSLLDSFIEQANQPVTMKTTVNPLPSFVGGGLPMPISAPGMDANRLNPALRTTPGLNLRRTFTPPGGRTPSPDAQMTGREAEPRSTFSPQPAPVSRARGTPGAAYGAQDMGGGGDPEAAVQLLMDALTPQEKTAARRARGA